MKQLTNLMISMMLLEASLQRRGREHLFSTYTPSRHPSDIYLGRSHTFKANLRKVQKQQRRRAYHKLQRKVRK